MSWVATGPAAPTAHIKIKVGLLSLHALKNHRGRNDNMNQTNQQTVRSHLGPKGIEIPNHLWNFADAIKLQFM